MFSGVSVDNRLNIYRNIFTKTQVPCILTLRDSVDNGRVLV